MPRGMRAIAINAAAVMLLATVGQAAAESPARLTVRVYNTSGIPTSELLAARHAAELILRDTGVDVVFRHCGSPVLPNAAIDPCEQSLQPSEVVVRVIDAPAFNATLHPEAYGVTYIIRDIDRGWLATVFSDRINEAAARVGVEPGELLGRVLAHEVGHLLLGNGYHGVSGLMRAEWTDAILSRKDDEWRFSMIEAERLHQVLASITRDTAAIEPPAIHF